MPAKGTSLRLGKREPILRRKFLRHLRKAHPTLDLTNREIFDICGDGNKLIVEAVINNPNGFRLPRLLGHVAITRFKSKTPAINPVASKLMRKSIPYTNLHSFGYRFAIRYFRLTGSNKLLVTRCYVLQPMRSFKKAVSKVIKETGGEQYINLKPNHFLSNSKIIKLTEKYG